MLGMALIVILAVLIVFGEKMIRPIEKRVEEKNEHSEKFDQQMKKLWSVAQESMKTKKPLRAEKALLTILKFDSKNAAAYNRLGILYAKEQNFDEAIECFEIAQSLDNNASSLHNVGLIYLETGAYEKAAMAFEQAIELEDDSPARFIALSHAYEKMGQRKKAVEALESAYMLDKSTSTLRAILSIYEEAEDTENIELTTARIEAKIADEAREKEAVEKSRSRRASSASRVSSHAHTTRKIQKRELFPTSQTTARTASRPTATKVSRKKKLVQ